MCFNCEVREECTAYKDETGTKHGIWGGVLQTRDKD
jgi:hypothetical protein